MLTSIVERLRTSRATDIEGEEAAEAGFTLIELMVVLLIIAILLAIAIPTFLGVTTSANDRAAQSNLTNALTESSAVYQSNNQSFTGLSTAILGSSAPEFAWTQSTCASSTANCVSFAVNDAAQTNDGQVLVLADASKSGECWYVVSVQATPSSSVGLFASNKPLANISNPLKAGTFYYKHTAASCGATDITNYSGGNASITNPGGSSWSSATSF